MRFEITIGQIFLTYRFYRGQKSTCLVAGAESLLFMPDNYMTAAILEAINKLF